MAGRAEVLRIAMEQIICVYEYVKINPTTMYNYIALIKTFKTKPLGGAKNRSKWRKYSLFRSSAPADDGKVFPYLLNLLRK